MGLGDRPVVTPCEIRDGRRVETTLLGERMSLALFSVDGRTLGARDDEGRLRQLRGIRDGTGAFPDGRKSYKLTGPQTGSVLPFWSATVYDLDTRCMIAAGQDRSVEEDGSFLAAGLPVSLPQ